MTKLEQKEAEWDNTLSENLNVLKIVKWLILEMPLKRKMSLSKIDNMESFNEAYRHIMITQRDRARGRIIRVDDTHFWKEECVVMDPDAGEIVVTIHNPGTFFKGLKEVLRNQK